MSEVQIGMRIDTDEPFNLSIKSIIASRTYIASITRYGKSWTCRKMIEEIFGHCAIIIIDPEGEYSSLREKYPFLIIGVDVPIQMETAEFMAEQVIKNELSVILDTSRERNDKEYVKRFLEQFFYLETTARKPYLLIVEEAEDYGPEKGAPGTAECLPILVSLAKKGGKRGIGCIFVGHRPAWISKGILSQCSNKALGKIESTDFKALEDYARIPRDIIERLPDFKPGEFCFVGDWIKEVSFVKIGDVKTTHLGMSPEIIPPSPKSLLSVIENLQKSLSSVIESVKPTVVNVSETEIRLKKKYEDEVTAIKKTADEKAARKYRAEIEQMRRELGDASRALTLQNQTPISDVLEHPIVKARMSQLDQRAKDLLVKIERESGLTREQLAAFLSASTNTVAGIVDQINQTFKAQAIIDDGGRPLKYRSVLKRLYLTDVGRREIDELNRLHISQLKSEVEQRKSQEKILSGTLQERNSSFEKLTRDLTLSQQIQKETDSQLSEMKKKNEALNEENKRLKELSKVGEIIDLIIREYIDKNMKTLNPASIVIPDLSILKNQVLDLKEDYHFLEKKIEDIFESQKAISHSAEASFEIEETKHVGTVIAIEKPFKFITDTLEGKIMLMAKDGYFDSWKRGSDVEKALVEKAWGADRISVMNTLEKLVNDGYLGKRRTDRLEFKLAPNVRFVE